MPIFDSASIGSLFREIKREYDPWMARLRIRRLLMELSFDKDLVGTGLVIPPPFDKSKLVLPTMIGDGLREVQRWQARIAANQPVVNVYPLSLSSDVPQRVQAKAGEQERLHAAQWEAHGGQSSQMKVAFSQAWGRCGYYLTLPRDITWGLPQRTMYEELSNEDVEALKRNGKIVPEPEDGKWLESGSSWLDRRKQASYNRAVSGDSLFHLEAVSPDRVMVRRDRAGIKWAFIVEQVPSSNYGAGSEIARSAAKLDGLEGADLDKYGLYQDKAGKIVGGVTKGAEWSEGGYWTQIMFLTRDEVYFLVASGNDAQGGKLVYHARHEDGCVPLVEVPFNQTDSDIPGHEATSPLDIVFSQLPLMNQLETLLSNVTAYNTIPRWYIALPDGTMQEDPEDPTRPWLITGDPVPGLDPKDFPAIRGEIKQLQIEGFGELVPLLQFYFERLDSQKLTAANAGAAGTAGPAWTMRQVIAQGQIDLQPAVDANARAVKQIHQIWVKRMRKLDVPVYCFSVPGHRSSGENTRGIIEFDPKDLVEAISVRQDSHTASDRVVLLQAGVELHQGGYIDDETFFEEYALKEDVDDAVLRKYVSMVSQAVLTGDNTRLLPGSVLFNVYQRVLGRTEMELLEQSPNAALVKAEEMAMSAQQQMQPSNPAAAMGIREAGMGMSLTQPGSPDMGAAPVQPIPAAVV